MNIKRLIILILTLLLTACASVNITKTGKGFNEPTNPASVEILKTVPSKKFVELGTLTVTGYLSTDSAKMHNAIRAKAATLGATGVIITDQGLIPAGFGRYESWATGVAIKYTD